MDAQVFETQLATQHKLQPNLGRGGHLAACLSRISCQSATVTIELTPEDPADPVDTRKLGGGVRAKRPLGIKLSE